MKKEIYTNDAPQAVGSYSQAVLVDDLIFLSGQIALDPQTGELKNDSIEMETGQVLVNLSAILKTAGMTVNNIAKVDIFLTDMNDFETVNTVYSQWLKKIKIKPTRQTVEVRALPKDARIEISCIAHVKL